MSKSKKRVETGEPTLVVGEDRGMPAKLKAMGGSDSDVWNNALVNQVLGSVWAKGLSEEERNKRFLAVIDALISMSLADETESMIAAQLIASHNAAMECYRRAMIPDQTFEGRRENLNQANKLSRSWATLLDAINKHRGKGHQKVTVEHLHVNQGGKAIVGEVNAAAGRGVNTETEEQPHEKQTGDASKPALPGADTGGNTLPVPGDAEWPVPDARGKVAGRAKGE
ncbi:MAG: hypothetical protein AAFR41_09940 [Pseudomonadota bacterium]